MINTQIMYYCKLKPGLSKLPCKEKTVLPTKCVRFFQDETAVIAEAIKLSLQLFNFDPGFSTK